MTVRASRGRVLVPVEGDSVGAPERITAVEARVSRLEDETSAHRRDYDNQFGQLRQDISNLGANLGARIDRMGEDLQGQITDLTLDKAKAEGRAEGVASVKAAIAAPKWWHPVVIGIVLLVLTAAVGLTGWLASTLFNQEQAEINALRNRPVASVTVSPAQPQQAPTLQQPPATPASPPPDPSGE